MSKLLSQVPNIFTKLSENQLECLHEQLKVVKNSKDMELLMEWWGNMEKWRFPRVSFDTFLDHPGYLGLGDSIYPEIRRMAKEIIDGKFSEGIIVAGIGSGKTTVSELIACYATHTLLCMRNPYETYSLIKDKPISIINMGINATQALEVAFAGIKSFIQKSPWFNRFSPRILNGSIRFPDHNILLISGNSQSTTPLGYNIYYAILDEAAFYQDSQDKQNAEEIYTALQKRIMSRFETDGLVMMISSPKYEGDFIMKKLEKARRFPDVIYAQHLPTWICKPYKKEQNKATFFFNVKKNLVEENPIFNPAHTVSRLSDKVFQFDADYWEIPIRYREAFLQDPIKAKRDIGAVPSLTIEAFLPHVDFINDMFTQDESPVQESGGYSFKELPLRTNYYIHLDLALNRTLKGDKAGFAMSHFDGWEINEETGERQMRVIVDLAEQIKAGPTGEIVFEDVRNKIYTLKRMGYNIALVSFDQFQSEDTGQILKAKGFKTEYLSVDKLEAPYNTFKQLIYSGRIKCHKSDILLKELKSLELLKSKKIDHPKDGSKDVADAVCGSVYQVIAHSEGEIGMVSASYYGGKSALPNPKSEINEREEHYKRLQDMADKGWI